MIRGLLLLVVIGVVILGAMGFPGIWDPHKSIQEKDGANGKNEIGKNVSDFLKSSIGQKEAANGSKKGEMGNEVSEASKLAKSDQSQAKTSESAVSKDGKGGEDGKSGLKENQSVNTDAQKNTSKESKDAGENSNGNGIVANKQQSSAFVRIMASNFSLNENHTAMLAAILSPIAGNTNSNSEVAKITITVVLENAGKEVASSVKFDGVFQIDGEEIKSVRTEIGKLGAGEKIFREFTYSIMVSEVPPSVINKMVKHITEDRYPVFSFEINNIDF